MKLATPKQMNEIDSYTINEIGIPGIVLMENAALRVVEEIERDLKGVVRKNIALFAGKGNNGGDAFAAARHLYNKGADVRVYMLAEKGEIKGDAWTNLAALDKMGVETVELLEKQQCSRLHDDLKSSDLIVDGILGTGLKGDVKGLVEEVIKIINNSGKAVISIDIPSGVSGETGKVLGTCINANKTVTFALPKIGLMVCPGCESAGELVVADIGIPSKSVDRLNIRLNTVDRDYVSGLLPLRFKNSNKGDYGKIFIVTGSVGMTGAGCLTAGAALRTGAGLVYIGVPSKLTSIYDTLVLESVTVPLEDNNTGYLSRNCIAQILERLKRSTAAAVGPGLSTSDDTVEIVGKIIESAEIPVVYDADALNAISRDVSVLKKLKTKCIITPHPGEMSRLGGITIEEVQNNRVEVAREFAAKWNVVTVLKGSRTIVADPDGEVYINTTGNPGMATGGTGDVLTGIITGLSAQGLKPLEAAVAGVYLHGLAGDNAAKIKGEHGMTAGDLVAELPYAIKGIIGK